jgi:hypothetical protein
MEILDTNRNLIINHIRYELLKHRVTSRGYKDIKELMDEDLEILFNKQQIGTLNKYYLWLMEKVGENKINSKEKLKGLMEISGYPIIQRHINNLERILIENDDSNYINDINELMKNENYDTIRIERDYFWTKIISEIKKGNITSKSNELRKYYALNVIPESVYRVMKDKRVEFISKLLKAVGEATFKNNYQNILLSHIKNSNFNEIYNVFEPLSKFNFKIIKDRDDELEFRKMLKILTNYEYSRKKSSDEKITFDLLMYRIIDEQDRITSKYVSDVDIMNFFHYLYNLKDIVVDLWGTINETKRLKFAVKRHKRRKEGVVKKDNKKWKYMEKGILNKIYNEFIQKQLERIMSPYNKVLIELITSGTDTRSLSEIRDMIRSGNFLYRTSENKNIQVRVKDYLINMILVIRDDKKMDKGFRNFILTHILKFITNNKIYYEKDDEMKEVVYMDLYLTPELEFDGVQLNHLVKYINLLNQIELTNEQRLELNKIKKVNNEIISEIFVSSSNKQDKMFKKIINLSKFTKMNLEVFEEDEIKKEEKEKERKLTKDEKDKIREKIENYYVEFTKEEKKLIIRNVNKISNSLLEYERDIKDSKGKKEKDDIELDEELIEEFMDLFVDTREEAIETLKEMGQKKDEYKVRGGKKNKFEYVKLLLKVYKEREIKLEKEDRVKVVKKKTFKKGKSFDLNKVLKDMENMPIMRHKIVEKKVENTKMSKYFKRVPDMISDDSKLAVSFEEYEMYRGNFEKQRINYLKKMTKMGEKVMTELSEKYNLFGEDKKNNLIDMLNKFLGHQEKYLDIVHKDVRRYMINQKMSIKSMIINDNRVTYEYMLLICILLAIIKGLDIKKIGDIHLLDENLLNLKAYDTVNNRFITVLKMESDNKVLVEIDGKKKKMNESDLVVGDYINVKIIKRGSPYKGQIGKVLNVSELTDEEKSKIEKKIDELRNDLKNNNLKDIEREVIKNELSKLVRQRNVVKVLVYEGFLHNKMVKFREDEVMYVPEGVRRRLVINKSTYKKIEEIGWGDSLLAYLYNTYNNLMPDTRTALGLGYFIRLYKRGIKQINEYLESMNKEIDMKEIEIKKHNKLLKKMKKVKKDRTNKAREVKLLKDKIERSKRVVERLKRRINNFNGSILRVDEKSKYNKYVNDFKIKGDKLYLNENKSDYNRIAKDFDDLKKVQENIENTRKVLEEKDHESFVKNMIKRVEEFNNVLKTITTETVNLEVSGNEDLERINELEMEIKKDIEQDRMILEELNKIDDSFI